MDSGLVRYDSIYDSMDLGEWSLPQATLYGEIGAEVGTQTLFFSFKLTEPGPIRLQLVPINPWTDRFLQLSLLGPDGMGIPLDENGFAREADIINTPEDESTITRPTGRYTIVLSCSQWQRTPFGIAFGVSPVSEPGLQDRPYGPNAVVAVAHVGLIPSDPKGSFYLHIVDSTGIENFETLEGRPVGFTGESGLSVLIYRDAAESAWRWISYMPNDAESRYAKDLGANTFTQAGTGAITRTITAKLQDTVSSNDFGAAGIAGRVNQALAAGHTVNVPRGAYTLEADVQPTSSALVIDPAATFTNPERLKPRGAYSDIGNGVNVWRLQDRLFLGGAVAVSPSTRPVLNGYDIAGDPVGLGSDYLERGAAFLSSNAAGGIGGTFATRQSRQYTSQGYSVWTSGQVVTAGAKRGYYEKLYTATTSGTCGNDPPDHTSGAESDGGVTWQFDRYTYMASIGLAAVADADVADGHGCWALYLEGVRRPAGGTVFGVELAMKNKGSLVANDPYNILPGGSTIGLWLAGGGDASLGAPANSSTCAIAIMKNAATWARGIVFAGDALNGDNIAIAFGQNHQLVWYSSNSVAKCAVKSSRTSSAVGVSGMEFLDTYGIILHADKIALAFSISGASDNSWVGVASGVNVAYVSASSSSADANLQVLSKGLGRVQIGPAIELPTRNAAATPASFGDPDHYFTVYDSSGAPYYVPAKANPW